MARTVEPHASGTYASVWARRPRRPSVRRAGASRPASTVDADAQPEHPFTAQVVDAGLIREPDTSADAVTLLGRLCGTRGSLFTRQRHLEAPARTGVRQIVLCGDL